jgi:hypothetical protein
MLARGRTGPKYFHADKGRLVSPVAILRQLVGVLKNGKDRPPTFLPRSDPPDVPPNPGLFSSAIAESPTGEDSASHPQGSMDVDTVSW